MVTKDTTPSIEKVKRRVAVVFGKFGKDTDFVLEPTCNEECQCEVCKDSIWIQEVQHDTKD